MAFYYIRDNGTFVGTATGDAGRSLTERTGSFDSMGVSACYPSVKAIFADQATTGNTLVDGDTIIIASDHNEYYTADTSFGVESVTQGVNVTFVSRDFTDAQQYLFGAKFHTSGSAHHILWASRAHNRNNMLFYGLDFTSLGDINFYARESLLYFYDCTIEPDDIGNPSYPNSYTYVSCRYKEDTLQAAGFHQFIDCVVSLNATTLGIRGGVVEFVSCDLSTTTCTTVSSYGVIVRYIKSKIPASFLNLAHQNSQPSWTLGATLNSCSVGGDYFYQGFVNYHYAYATSTLTYLNYKYDDISSASIKLETNATVGLSIPARFKLCEIPAQDLSLTDKTYRVNLLLDTDTVATLTNTDAWVELHHNDNTNLALGKLATNRNTEILATGVELESSSEVWQGTLPTNTKAYQIDITLTAAQLTNVTNSNVEIYLNVATPNTDVYVCPAVQIGT